MDKPDYMPYIKQPLQENQCGSTALGRKLGQEIQLFAWSAHKILNNGSSNQHIERGKMMSHQIKYPELTNMPTIWQLPCENIVPNGALGQEM